MSGKKPLIFVSGAFFMVFWKKNYYYNILSVIGLSDFITNHYEEHKAFFLYLCGKKDVMVGQF